MHRRQNECMIMPVDHWEWKKHGDKIDMDSVSLHMHLNKYGLWTINLLPRQIQHNWLICAVDQPDGNWHRSNAA